MRRDLRCILGQHIGLACIVGVLCWCRSVRSSIDDAVSSSELACCSVRVDRSKIARRPRDTVTMVSVPARTSVTVLSRLSFWS
jgi:hypothetical protein